jgi:hypothetical protein
VNRVVRIGIGFLVALTLDVGVTLAQPSRYRQFAEQTCDGSARNCCTNAGCCHATAGDCGQGASCTCSNTCGTRVGSCACSCEGGTEAARLTDNVEFWTDGATLEEATDSLRETTGWSFHLPLGAKNRTAFGRFKGTLEEVILLFADAYGVEPSVHKRSAEVILTLDGG